MTVPASAARFAGLADEYARYRPSYPAIAIATLLDGLPVPADVVDVGAGTGIGTRALLTMGARVIGIEPSADMRAAAIANGLDVRLGTATATELPDACADLVTAFQAFHWFASAEALGEFRRLLRPRGRVAAIWNERDTKDSFANGLRAIEMRCGEAAMLAAIGDEAEDATLDLLTHNGFGNARRSVFANSKTYDEAAILGRLRSLSFAPPPGPERDAFVAETRALFIAHCDERGLVTLRMETVVYVGERSVII